MDYLALPLVLREGYLSRTSLEESITFSIGLIFSTRMGMMPFAPEYGCALWEREYSDLLTANKADIRASLRNAIDLFEKRLYNVSVSFTSVANHASHPLGMMVRVRGNYREDGEEKRYESNFLVG